MNTLIYCRDILKIEADNELYRNALDLVQKNPIEPTDDSDEWIRALEIIASASVTLYIFSQSQLSDFLTLSAKSIEEKRISSEIIIFKMYRDIIENYENFSNSLKLSIRELLSMLSLLFILTTSTIALFPIGF